MLEEEKKRIKTITAEESGYSQTHSSVCRGKSYVMAPREDTIRKKIKRDYYRVQQMINKHDKKHDTMLIWCNEAKVILYVYLIH